MSISEIVEELPKLTAVERDALRFKLLEYDHDPHIDGAWRETVAARVAEIREGRVDGVPGSVVSERIAKIVGR